MKAAGDAVAAALAQSELAAKRARWKRNAWSRHWNGACDRPVFRLVAARVALPVFQVIALAMRLDELANAAEPRGSVAEFSAAEFGIALGMPADEALRIFEGLGAADIGYLAYGHVADFYDRNRDTDADREGAKERQRRVRAKRDGLRAVAVLAARGEVDEEERLRIERMLDLPPRKFSNEDLHALVATLERAELSTDARHVLSQRDSVTVTQERSSHRPEQTSGAVDNFGDVAGGAEEGPTDQGPGGAGSDPQAAARQWMEIEGRRIAIARMSHEQPGRVDTLLERWRDQDLDGDAVALMTVLLECDRLNLVGASFHVGVKRACDRWRRQRDQREDTQATLPLGGVRPVRSATGGS